MFNKRELFVLLTALKELEYNEWTTPAEEEMIKKIEGLIKGKENEAEAVQTAKIRGDELY